LFVFKKREKKNKKCGGGRSRLSVSFFFWGQGGGAVSKKGTSLNGDAPLPDRHPKPMVWEMENEKGTRRHKERSPKNMTIFFLTTHSNGTQDISTHVASSSKSKKRGRKDKDEHAPPPQKKELGETGLLSHDRTLKGGGRTDANFFFPSVL